MSIERAGVESGVRVDFAFKLYIHFRAVGV